ncbi:MAG: hypothetical protein V4481_04815 [Patescibacteria group bacterium]
MSSANQGGTSEPTPEEERLIQANPDRTTENYNNLPNPLGDYSNLMSQMKGFQGSLNDGFIMKTLDSRRTINKITDQSGDGYNMLANTFVLHERSAKAMKKARKNPKLGSQNAGWVPTQTLARGAQWKDLGY